MSDKNTLYKQNITRAMRAGMDFNLVSGSVQDVQHVSFSSQLYESSMLRHSVDSESGQLYFRFKGYSRLSDKQKCIEEVIRQAEIYHEDQIGIQVIKWIQEQSITTRYRYLSSAGLLFGMKFGQLDLYSYNRKKHQDIITQFFEKAISASVPPIDVIRYHRLITEGKYVENEYYSALSLHLYPNSEKFDINTTPTKCEPSVFNSKPFADYIKKHLCSKIKLYNLQEQPIIVQNEEGEDVQLEVEYYPNDSLETIRCRYAILNQLPYETIYMKEVESQRVEEEIYIENVPIQFIANKKWRYSSFESKKLICTSIIDIIEQYPIRLDTEETIKESIDDISEKFQTYCNIDKKDGYYIYLLVRSIFFNGLSIVNDEETECVPPETIIHQIENQIDYIELLLAKPIEPQVFKVVIANYCKSYLTTLQIGKQYITLYPEEEQSYIQNTFECLRGIGEYKKLPTETSFITNIHETNFTITGEIIIDGVDIYEFFNLFDCNQTVPFLNLHHFYKCLNGAKCPTQWANPEEEHVDTLRFYMCQIDLPDLRDENYSLCECKQIKNEKGIYTYEYTIYGTVHTEIESLLTKFIQLCPVKPSKMTVHKKFGKGNFICTGIPFNEDLFYDFATNERIVSEMVTIDEKYKIHKIRGGLKFVVHLNRFNQKDTLRCILRSKVIEKSTDQEMKDFPGMFKVGQTILTINCSGALQPHLLEFYKKMLDSILYYISASYKHQMIDYYCHYIDNISEIVTPILKKDKIQTELSLKEIAPDLFLPGYVRSCSYPPVIIQDNQIEEHVRKGFQVMTFPKESSGLVQHNYVCTKDKKKIYPGLRLNEMDNSELYPAVPCCYQDDQTTETNIRYKYEHDLPLVDEGAISTTFISTRKCLKLGQEGILPPVVKNFLTTTDDDCLLNKSQFIRIAVPKGNWSVFDALKIATKKEITVEQFINRCTELVEMNLCSQSELTVQEALHILQSRHYMEIRDWYPILETIFEVKITIFATTKDNLDGELSCPNYKRFYIINPLAERSYTHTVLLLNTIGGEFDRLQYPHNEVIVKRETIDKKKEYMSMFSLQSNTAKAIVSVTKLIMNQKEIPFHLPITQQKQDGYGKIREVHINEHILYTTPLPPILTSSNKKKLKEDLFDIMEQNMFYQLESIQHNQKEIGIIATNTTHHTSLVYKWNIPKDVQDTDLPMYDVEQHGYPIPPSSSISFLKKYNQYQRLANMITSYALFLFSYLKWNEKCTLADFKEKHMIIIPDHTYTNISRNLDLQNDSFIYTPNTTENKQSLIITSLDMKLRVFYYVQMCMEYNESFLDAYRFNRYIPFYYNSSEDFSKSITYTIYNHIEEYLETRRLKKPQYTLYSTLFKSKTSYFFSNPLFRQGELFLVIPSLTKEHAIRCTTLFYQKGVIHADTDYLYDSDPLLMSDITIVEYHSTTDELFIHTPIKSRVSRAIFIGKLVLFRSKEEIIWFSMIPYTQM